MLSNVLSIFIGFTFFQLFLQFVKGFGNGLSQKVAANRHIAPFRAAFNGVFLTAKLRKRFLSTSDFTASR